MAVVVVDKDHLVSSLAESASLDTAMASVDDCRAIRPVESEEFSLAANAEAEEPPLLDVSATEIGETDETVVEVVVEAVAAMANVLAFPQR